MNVRDAHDASKEKRKIERMWWNGRKKEVMERGRQYQSQKSGLNPYYRVLIWTLTTATYFFAHCMSFLRTLKTTQFLRFKKKRPETAVSSRVRYFVSASWITWPSDSHCASCSVCSQNFLNVTDLAAVEYGLHDCPLQVVLLLRGHTRVLVYARSPNGMVCTGLKKQLVFRLALFSFESKWKILAFQASSRCYSKISWVVLYPNSHRLGFHFWCQEFRAL